ncbi:MAG: sulfate adenylyltransferase subunit CysD [Pseudobacteriovorax sp.]|nr:sulfate adenylyltransferase subunit CysD [Pseudobacteriovorax sp.]
MSNTEHYLKQLEAESIFIMREVAATAENPVILYSVGKDSSVLLHLAKKAFLPGKMPFPLLHIDTGYKFPEMIQFRDNTAKENGFQLLVSRNEPAIRDNANPEDLGTKRCCQLLKTQALLDGLSHNGFDVALGGARRDEEKSRAKERFFSFRDQHGQWDPKNQRPELWDLYNSRIKKGESIRVFPLSNWSEVDIWRYIAMEEIPIVSLYYAQQRHVVQFGNTLIPVPEERENSRLEWTRYRTLGCMPCTGIVKSTARTLDEIVEETQLARVSERNTRVIDHDSSASMEDKKREGYF